MSLIVAMESLHEQQFCHSELGVRAIVHRQDKGKYLLLLWVPRAVEISHAMLPKIKKIKHYNLIGIVC